MSEIANILERLERLEREVAEIKHTLNRLLDHRYRAPPPGKFPIAGEDDFPKRITGDDDFPRNPFRGSKSDDTRTQRM